ncbi:hypothetical protein CDD83_2933 [Cordyceps sp. RAO-2017]|nr:hypothetical protein CDD83_2933 [Cordyceps sp. RAO-2017]
MRLNLLALVVALAARAWAESDEEEEREPEPQPTIFNSVTVPPPFELTPTNWEHEVKKTKWLIVKHYSPYCPHCIDFLPVYQTAYEFYHTSKSPDGKPFADEYDFRFAVINCVAHSEFCEDHNVKSWPTTVIYKDGERR